MGYGVPELDDKIAKLRTETDRGAIEASKNARNDRERLQALVAWSKLFDMKADILAQTYGFPARVYHFEVKP